jgi:hypothetical protein
LHRTQEKGPDPKNTRSPTTPPTHPPKIPVSLLPASILIPVARLATVCWPNSSLEQARGGRQRWRDRPPLLSPPLSLPFPPSLSPTRGGGLPNLPDWRRRRQGRSECVCCGRISGYRNSSPPPVSPSMQSFHHPLSPVPLHQGGGGTAEGARARIGVVARELHLVRGRRRVESSGRRLAQLQFGGGVLNSTAE